ncbi:MAG: LPS export ABC transporter periplasmic protein LptC [Cyanobacteriota bacterium]|jgi:hypothetical protein
MRPTGLAVALIPLLLMACDRPPPRSETAPAFVFRSLRLRHQDDRGRTGWELSSPETRYDVRRRLARARNPLGVIHAKGSPLYRLSARSGTVLNDGQVILLEGQARIERLGPSPVLIQGRRLRWIPSRGEVLIDRSPQANTGPFRLLARRATLFTTLDRLDLEGRPELQRWQEGRPIGRGSPEMVLSAGPVRWHPGTGALRAAGPVAMQRRPDGGPIGQAPQRLSAAGLVGNTSAQWLELGAPVQIRDPAETLQLSLGRVRLNLIDGTASSPDPFSGSQGRVRLRGRGLTFNQADHRISVSQGCHLQRPDATLQARQCRWNWRDQSIAANGDVQLNDLRQGRTTRSQVLEGRLGEGAALTFSSPGGRVVSRMPVAAPR